MHVDVVRLVQLPHSLWTVVRPPKVGNDGLTDEERATYAARFEETVGRTPEPGPEREVRMKLLASKVPHRPRPRIAR
jgi:hypothetical protein